MAKQPEQATEASRIAALEEWSRGTAEFMAGVNTRVSECENGIRDLGARVEALEAKIEGVEVMRENNEVVNGRLLARLEALEKQMSLFDKGMQEHENRLADVGHVSRATAENAPIDGDVFARIKRLEQHAGIKQS